MKPKFLKYSLLLCILVLVAGGIPAVSADDTATGQVSVTSLTIDPEGLIRATLLLSPPSSKTPEPPPSPSAVP